jgi:hypothetical protein
MNRHPTTRRKPCRERILYADDFGGAMCPRMDARDLDGSVDAWHVLANPFRRRCLVVERQKVVRIEPVGESSE